MEELSLKDLWTSHHRSIEQSLVLHKKNAEEITKLKVNSLLSSMKPIKIFTLIAGILWVLPIGFMLVNLLVFAYDKVSPFFLYSALFQVLVTAIAIAVYIYQLGLLFKTDFSESVLQLQDRISRLRVSTLWVTRILFLQLPAWTTFYLTKETIQNGSPGWLVLQVVITGIFTLAGLWIFFGVRYENRDKKWFRWLFQGKEWTPLLQSVKLLEEIDELKSSKDH